MKKILFLLSTCTIILICCKTTSKTTVVPKVDKMVPDSADESYAKTKWSDATKESLTEGYNLYIANCGKCHEFKKPKNYSEQQLGFDVPDMAERAMLTKPQGELILRYMLAKKNATP